MYVPFDELSGQSRIWIYQANREFSGGEENIIFNAVRSFCEQWAAHGQPLRTSCRIDYHRFLVVSVDENFTGASGCSIDGSVQVLKSIQDQLNVDFFDRSKAAFLVGAEVTIVPFVELKSSFASGVLSPDTLAFNTQAAAKEEWENNRTIPVRKTWMTKYLPDPATV